MKNINHNESNSENVETGNHGVRPEYTCNLLVSVIAHVSSDLSNSNDSQDDTSDATDAVQGIFDGAFGEFAHCDVIESFKNNGVRSSAENGWKPEKFENVNVIAEIWEKVQITLPFDPRGKLSLSQQRYIHRNVIEFLSDIIDAQYEAHITDAGVWLADDACEPTVFLTGMFDVLEGRLTERKLKRFTANALASIPSELLGSDKPE